MCHLIVRSQAELDSVLNSLKLSSCPHCKRVGTLVRHGFLYGYDHNDETRKSVRARRVFCRNRGRANGCGRTFSIWIAERIKRLSINADSLLRFLSQAIATGNKLQAFRAIDTKMSDSTPYRIWKRFQNAQHSIRTALSTICSPPSSSASQPAALSIAHLKRAFCDAAQNVSGIAAFQVALQRFFI